MTDHHDITVGIPDSSDALLMAAVAIMAFHGNDTTVLDVVDTMKKSFESNGFELVTTRPSSETEQ